MTATPPPMAPSCARCGGSLEYEFQDCPCGAVPARRVPARMTGEQARARLRSSPLFRTLDGGEALAMLEARAFPPVADPAGFAAALEASR